MAILHYSTSIQKQSSGTSFLQSGMLENGNSIAGREKDDCNIQRRWNSSNIL